LVRTIERSAFSESVSRGGESEAPRPTSAIEAALLSFSQRIQWDENMDAFRILPGNSTGGSAAGGRRLELRFVDKDGREVATVNATGPAAQESEAWVLSLSSRELYRMAITSGAANVSIPQGLSGRACVAFTFRENASYSASPAQVFELAPSRDLSR
jgi:hypothetical protein